MPAIVRPASAGACFAADDDGYVRELSEFVAVPSVSRDADAATMLAAAQLAGWPAVLRRRPGRGDGRPPRRPRRVARRSRRADRSWSTGTTTCSRRARTAEWRTPPFELAVDGDVVRGRGATDDKGPVYIVLKTAQAFIAQEGGLPLNVKFLFEGEEEIGSPHLPDYVAAHAAELAADLVISADGAMWRPGEPSLSLASKGLVSMDIVVEGASSDLHSGRYGGTVANPLHALSQILASLHDRGRAGRRAGLLRRHPGADRRAPRRDRRRALRRSGLPRRPRPRRGARRARLHARSSGCGNGRRWKSTASAAAASTP